MEKFEKFTVVFYLLLIIVGVVCAVAIGSTPASLKSCDWYKNWDVSRLPVRCFNYYNVPLYGINRE